MPEDMNEALKDDDKAYKLAFDDWIKSKKYDARQREALERDVDKLIKAAERPRRRHSRARRGAPLTDEERMRGPPRKSGAKPLPPVLVPPENIGLIRGFDEQGQPVIIKKNNLFMTPISH